MYTHRSLHTTFDKTIITYNYGVDSVRFGQFYDHDLQFFWIFWNFKNMDQFVSNSWKTCLLSLTFIVSIFDTEAIARELNRFRVIRVNRLILHIFICHAYTEIPNDLKYGAHIKIPLFVCEKIFNSLPIFVFFFQITIFFKLVDFWKQLKSVENF